ncbi:MAG: hypothetical protein H6718_10210 [Polyangiaceae bacterium]|nr:hypothetical protein [Polyangiaceae bacterium]
MKRTTFSSRVWLIFPLGLALFGSGVGCSDSDGGSGTGTAGLCTTYCNRANECGALGSTTMAECQSSCSSAAPQCTPTNAAYQACDSALKSLDCGSVGSTLPSQCEESTLCQGSGNGGNGGNGNGGSGGGGNGGSGGGGACDTYCAKFVECGFIQSSDQAGCVTGCQQANVPAGCDFNACASAVGATSCNDLTSGGYPAACDACSEG